MMNCPACGAANSVKKTTCYQCNAPLHETETSPQAETGKFSPPVKQKLCAECCHACIFPPPGSRLQGDEVWCGHLDSAIDGNAPAGDCYAEPFVWRREETLD